MTMERIQLAGFGDVDKPTKERVLELAEKEADRFDALFEEFTLGLHLKGPHKAANDGNPQRTRFELHVNLQTPEKTFSASDTEHDLVKVTHSVLDKLKRAMEHSLKK